MSVIRLIKTAGQFDLVKLGLIVAQTGCPNVTYRVGSGMGRELEACRMEFVG